MKPFVTVSYAQTLDGRLATLSGSSQWIGGPESLRFAHELRAGHDAIMVGIGTVRQDDPRLTVRLVAGRNPLRVIVDSRLQISPQAAVLRDGAAGGTLLATTGAAPAERIAYFTALGATVLPLPATSAGQVDLSALLAALAARGIASVMVEGGAALITSLLAARLVDRMAVCLAPKILGTGLAAVGDLSLRELAHAYRLAEVQWRPAGNDMICDGRLIYAPQEDR